MTIAKKFTLAAALVIGATQAMAADKFAFYQAVEGWNIFKDSEKMSCFIEKSDELGNVVQMGLTEQRDVGYVGVFTKAETGIKKGEEKEIGIIIGDNVYLGKSTGMNGNITEGFSGGYVLSDDPNFVEDIKQQYEMVVFPDAEFAFSVNLDGTKKAIEAAVVCNNSF